MGVMVYTKHGLRAHYRGGLVVKPGARQRTFCGDGAYALSNRSRFFRWWLGRASVCRECAGAHNRGWEAAMTDQWKWATMVKDGSQGVEGAFQPHRSS